jgi:phosphocarrier protein
MIERRMTLCNRLGLHARAASKLVQTAGRFEAETWIERNGRRVNAKSIMGVLLLAAPCGSELLVRTEGADAEAAMQAVQALIDERFGESE